MRAYIGPKLIPKLPKADETIYDTKLTGFAVRCRASGKHAYRYVRARGDIVTIGRVADMDVTAARATAESMRADLSRGALERINHDPKVTPRQARTAAQAELRRHKSRRRPTWADFLAEYEALATADMKSAGETLRRLRAGFGFPATKRLDEITTFDLERWRAARRRAGVSASTVHRDLDVLRAALNWAVRGGLVAANPAIGLQRVKSDRTAPVRYLSDDEETRLRDTLAARDARRRDERDRANDWRRERGYDLLPDFGGYTDHLTPFVLLALNTGARRGELFNLTWADVDLTAKQVTFRGGGTKNRQTRVIPLNAEAVAVLTSWTPEGHDPAGFVFPGEDGGRLTDIKTAWTALRKAAKLPAFRFHDCRHHFASRLVQEGVDLAVVRELLGHSNTEITLRYAHLAPQHRADAVAKIVRA